MNYRMVFMVLVVFLSFDVSADYKEKISCNVNGLCSLKAESSLCSLGYENKVRLDLGSNTYIYMCECDCTSQENYGWLVRKDRSQFYVHEASASKIVKLSDILSVNGQIPDKFGSTPLCDELNQPTDLISLKKIPASGSNPSPPYCYAASNITSNLESCQSELCGKAQKEIYALDKSLERDILKAFLEQTRNLIANQNDLKDFSRSDFIRARIDPVSLKGNQQIYNDIAYFWQQAGYHREAIWLLAEILNIEPKRTVAHLNIADSLWAEGDTIQAKEHYQLYVRIMEGRKKQSLIPGRVFSRLGSTKN